MLLDALEAEEHQVGVRLCAGFWRQSVGHLVQRLVVLPTFQVVRDLDTKHKDSILVCNYGIVAWVGIDIGVLVVGGASQSVNAEGNQFVFQERQEQVLKCAPLYSGIIDCVSYHAGLRDRNLFQVALQEVRVSHCHSVDLFVFVL